MTEPLSTVYFGGGTPGLVEPEIIASIIEGLKVKLRFTHDLELTLETTPHAISKSKVEQWIGAGVNRLSIGIESLSEDELKAIGRDHGRQQALEGIAIAAEKFDNICIDFMYGLPTQSVESFQKNLDEAMALASKFPIKHLSAYALHLAENAKLYSKFPKASESYPEDEIVRQMYFRLVETVEKAGFQQYEVSNFARPGFRSRHNQVYWRGSNYLGFGVSAHRLVNGVRSSNWRSLNRYMRDWMGLEMSETIDPDMKIREAIILGLRLREGLDTAVLLEETGYDLLSSKRRQIERLSDGGFIAMEGTRLKLTQEAVMVSNLVLSDLI